MDINNEFISRMEDDSGENDTNANIVDVIAYERMKNTHVINGDKIFYYNEDTKELTWQFDSGEKMVYKQVN